MRTVFLITCSMNPETAVTFTHVVATDSNVMIVDRECNIVVTQQYMETH